MKNQGIKFIPVFVERGEKESGLDDCDNCDLRSSVMCGYVECEGGYISLKLEEQMNAGA